MNAKTFVDSNVLIYAHDADQGMKRTVAQTVLAELFANRTGALSPQVLQEFYVNITKKVAIPLSKKIAREIVDDFSVWCIETTSVEVTTAFRIEDEAKISFWDALICASALKAGADRVLSEDMSHGQKIAGLSIQNPFAAKPSRKDIPPG
jgi:predicted nucleic acid-binding protein